MTRCLRFRDLEKAEDIANMFRQKTELRSTRFGIKFRESSPKKQLSVQKKVHILWRPHLQALFKILGCSAKVSLQRLNGMGKLKQAPSNHHFASINHLNNVRGKFCNVRSSFSNKHKLLIFTVFSLGETNALIIFAVEYNLLISTGTFALRFDLVPSQMSVSPVICMIDKM